MSLLDFAKHTGKEVLTALADPVRYSIIRQAWKLMPWQKLELDDYFFLLANGGMTAASFANNIRELGFKNDVWTAEQYRIFKGNAAGLIDLDDARFGIPGYGIQNVLKMDKGVITPSEILELVNRGLLSERAARYILKIHFKGESHLAQSYMTLRNEIPPVQDLVHFAVREVFNPEVVVRHGLNKEFPSELLQWAQKQGIGWSSGMPMPPGATTITGPDASAEATWFHLQWMAHWVALSPGQWYECLQRFYRASPHGPSPEVNDLNATTVDDVRFGLKVADYPPPLRERLIALSYRPLGRIDIRRMYNSDVLNEDQAYHAFRANGYDDTRAEQLLTYAKQAKATAKFAKVRARTINFAKRAVIAGLYDGTVFQQRLTAIGLSVEEASIEWTALQAEIDTINLEGWIKIIKRNYIEGNMTESNARDMLNRLAIRRPAIDLYIQTWNSIKFFGRKFITAEKAVGMYKLKIVSVDQLSNKLLNLGYTGPEVSLIIQEANLNLTNAAQKQLIALEKKNAADTVKARKEQLAAAKAQAAANEKATKAVTTKQEMTLRKALAPFTKANMKEWYAGKGLTEHQVDTITTLLGWSPEAVKAFKEVTLGIGKKPTTTGA